MAADWVTALRHFSDTRRRGCNCQCGRTGAALRLPRMEWDLKQELEQLHRAGAVASPVARLRAINHRLASMQPESPGTRLIAMLSGVEALARSLIVHAAGRPTSTAEMRYRQVRMAGPVELVEDVLRLYGAAEGAAHFGAGPWMLFGLAHDYRNLLVHECARIEHERCTVLAAAVEQVFKGLVEVGGLPRVVA